MKKAIRQFLDREEELERIRRETLERWARYQKTGETVSHEEVEAWLKTWRTDGEGNHFPPSPDP